MNPAASSVAANKVSKGSQQQGLRSRFEALFLQGGTSLQASSSVVAGFVLP